MEKKWFTLNDGFIAGPLSLEEMENQLNSGKLSSDSQFWWNGSDDWLNISDWEKVKNNIPSKVIQLKNEPVWYAEKNKEILGPFQKDKLLDFLRSAKGLSNVKVWKKGEKNKATVYQYGDLSDALGIVKRTDPRAPIVGDVVIQKEGGYEALAKLVSISSGGLGITLVDGLTEGEIVIIKISSPLLSAEINAHAKVRYITPYGRIGLQFDKLHSESASAIIEYVRQFAEKPSTAAA